MRFVWIPEKEKPTMAGPLYAIHPRYNSEANATLFAEEARHFPTMEECKRWCEENPYPIFVPREHGFGD